MNRQRVTITFVFTILCIFILANGGLAQKEVTPGRPERLGEDPAGATQSPDAGPTILISLNGSGQQTNGESVRPATDSTSRIITFQSDASNLVGDDTNGVSDIFTKNTENGNVRRVSVASGGTQGNAASQSPDISSDGQWVAFHSWAFNLVSGDTNNVADVFLHDRNTRQTFLVSKNNSGTISNDVSYDPSVSSDGRFVAYWSFASNLVANDFNNRSDIFVYDRQTNQTQRVSVNNSGQEGNGDSKNPAISADGRFVVYESRASNLVAGDSGSYTDIFLFDRNSGTTTRLSVRGNGAEGQGDSFEPDISSDGTKIVFTSLAANLIDGDTNGYPDIFYFDRSSGLMYRVSISSSGGQGNEWSEQPVVSDNGQYIAFRSRANNLVPNDTNNIGDVFVRNFPAGTTTRVSVSSTGGQGNDASNDPGLTADGRYVVFASRASNLVSNDNNGLRDIFRKDQQDSPPPPPPTLTSNQTYGAPGSYFTITGSNYPANQNAVVFANYIFISSGIAIPTGPDGNFQFLIRTDGILEGQYIIAVGVPGVTLPVVLTISWQGPTWPKLADGPEVFIPPSVAPLNRYRYSPILRK